MILHIIQKYLFLSFKISMYITPFKLKLKSKLILPIFIYNHWSNFCYESRQHKDNISRFTSFRSLIVAVLMTRSVQPQGYSSHLKGTPPRLLTDPTIILHTAALIFSNHGRPSKIKVAIDALKPAVLIAEVSNHIGFCQLKRQTHTAVGVRGIAKWQPGR